MIKKLSSLLLLILIVLSSKAAVGDWTIYPSYHNATYCEVAGNKLYVLASGALFSYNMEDNETLLYDNINTLSDIDISHIAYSKAIKALVIVYKNANIDILYDDESIYNISDFKNKTLPSKTINNIDIQGSTAYISTSFGVVVLDLENLEFSNTYSTGYNTYCTYLFNDRLYTGTSEGVFRGSTKDNLLDKNNWEKVNYYPTQAFCKLGGELYCLIRDLGIYRLNDENNRLTLIVKNSGEKYYTIYNSGTEIVAPSKDKVTIIKSITEFTTYKTETGSSFIKKNGNTFWSCNSYSGVVECKIDNDRLSAIKEPLQPNSPVRNYCEFMKFTKDGKLLVTGGTLNYFDNIFHEGTIMEYDHSTLKWFNFPEETIKETTGLKYVNICSIDEDPTEPGHYFASSFGYGIYEFRNKEFVKHYNHLNSPLESVLKTGAYIERYVRIPTVEFDNEGNLWCINTGVKNTVKIFKKDGSWLSLNYKELENLPTVAKPLLDSRGWLWITSLQGEPGLFCAKTNKTPFDTADDEKKIWLNKFTNQDGISYDIYQLYAFIEDNNGHLWVGTNTGLFIIDNPENFFKNGIFKQIKVPRNDGTGLADYLMNGVYIKSIAIDGANRKWIGTNDNGIYLLSADGLEEIHHFTTENSPLPSNNIESIAIDHTTGEVFIGTNKGMASYTSDATAPEQSLNENNIHAYPNPVRADYSGNILITGLTADCNVKIVDTAGFLINEGISLGGQYSWNGRNSRGEKVSSGVYYVLTYDSNGNEGVATKILITR